MNIDIKRSCIHVCSGMPGHMLTEAERRKMKRLQSEVAFAMPDGFQPKLKNMKSSHVHMYVHLEQSLFLTLCSYHFVC